jgi:hypothetical protein
VKKDYCHRPLEDEGNMVVSIAKLRNSISEWLDFCAMFCYFAV